MRDPLAFLASYLYGISYFVPLHTSLFSSLINSKGKDSPADDPHFHEREFGFASFDYAFGSKVSNYRYLWTLSTAMCP